MVVYIVGNGVNTYLATPSLSGAMVAHKYLAFRKIESVISTHVQRPRYWEHTGDIT